MKMLKQSIVVLLAVGFFLTIGMAGLSEAAEKSVNVGAKSFTEQYVVGNLISLLLKEHGFDVKERFGTGSKITRDGLTTGQTDLYAEYTGTAWVVYLQREEKINDPVELYEKVKAEDLEKYNIVWLDRFSLNNTYALAISKDKVETYGGSLSELAAYVNENPGELTFGVGHEFYERPDGFFAMADAYGLQVEKKDVKTMDLGLTYEAINQDQIDIAMVFATDGKLKKFDLQVLKDNKQFFPVYNLCVTVRKDTLEKYPEIAEILKPLAERMDDETAQILNYRVDAEGIPAKEVAKEFLKEQGLIK